jgi:hypothetical protein
MALEAIEKWRDTFRRGIAPTLSDAALEALRVGLLEDDPRVLQGCSTRPPPLTACWSIPCEAACPIGYAGWQGEGIETVGGVEEFLRGVLAESDRLTGERGSARHLLNWVDCSPRDVVRREMLAEIRREQERRLEDQK